MIGCKKKFLYDMIVPEKRTVSKAQERAAATSGKKVSIVQNVP